jgi:transposase
MPAEAATTVPPVAVGVDISKAYLDVDAPAARWRVPNTPAGVRELLQQLPPGARLFVEAGSYGRCLRDAAFAGGVPIALLNPLRVRFFAKSRGLLAKTDRLDARALRLYGESTPCRFAQPVVPELEQLAVLVSLRDQLVKTLTQLSNCAEHVPAALRAGQQALAAVRKQLRQQIAKLEVAARQLIAAQPALAERAKALLAVYGIGDVISFTLLAGLPELGTVNRGEIAALAGLAPHAHDSGTSSGRRRIRGGRTNVRRALYLATLTAVRRQGSVLRRSYLHLRHNGKPPKAALAACARKFLLFLNSKIQKLASLKLSLQTASPAEA